MSLGAARQPDLVVIGGGLVGAALAYGVARNGVRVTVLDEGDVALRASRGNFALVWVQSKGHGLPAYSAWTQQSARNWPVLAEQLRDEAGIDVALRQPGGFTLCLSEEELSQRASAMQRLMAQPGMSSFHWELLGAAETRRRLPTVGPDVAGSIFCPLDGDVNSLRLFRALHTAMGRAGVDYRQLHGVDRIRFNGGEFAISGRWGEMRTPKVVLTAGLGNARLGAEIGLQVPVRPSKGQIIVTEKVAPFLPYPMATLRQTDEGSVMIGDSQEDAGLDTTIAAPVMAQMAERAARMFPLLSDLNVVRTWSALRVMSPDGFPIYDQSASCPGAFVATCHSGVTLAASHALELSSYLAAGQLPDTLSPFSSRRLHVPSAA